MQHKVDLHLHTTHSDGRLTPAQLVNLVASRGLEVVAITDHDSIEGLAEAREEAKKHPKIELIPGMELSCDVPEGEVHILAYYVDTENTSLRDTLQRFRDTRLDRGRRMVEKLEVLGMPLSWERVLSFSDGGSVGRPHVARAMIEEGYVVDNQEAFDKYLGRHGPAYAERTKLTPIEAIRMASDAGALPVLAHPSYVDDYEAQFPAMVQAGLIGMEVYYGNYGEPLMRSLKRSADKYGLVPCGGSDYHAMGHDGEALPGSAGPPVSTAERLEALRNKRRQQRGSPS